MNDATEPTRGERAVYLGASALLAGAVWLAAGRAAQSARARKIATGRHIVILGGGFAGVSVARELMRQLPEEAACRVTLVNETNYMLFTPLLTEVAGGQLDPGQVVSPLRRLAPSLTIEQARIERIDLAKRAVHLCIEPVDTATPVRHKTLHADHLVMALGSTTNDYGIPGLREHALTMKGLSDAAVVSNRILALLERASEETDAQVRRALLTVVVGGGGFSGVETMAAVNDFLRDAAARYPHVPRHEIRTLLIHMEGRLLPEFDKALAKDAQRELRRRGVEIWLNTKVTSAGPDHVATDRHGRLAAHTLIWAGGVEANPIIKALDAEHGHGGAIVVDGCCAVPDYPGVWALGDCAEVPKPNGHGTYAPIAQNATREGRLVAENIVAVLSGEAPRPFAYRPVGQMALVGRRAGVARLWGFRFSGLIAWAMWRAVYLAKMPSSRRRVRIGVDWLLDMVFGHDVVEMPGPVSAPGMPQGGKEEAR